MGRFSATAIHRNCPLLSCVVSVCNHRAIGGKIDADGVGKFDRVRIRGGVAQFRDPRLLRTRYYPRKYFNCVQRTHSVFSVPRSAIRTFLSLFVFFSLETSETDSRQSPRRYLRAGTSEINFVWFNHSCHEPLFSQSMMICVNMVNEKKVVEEMAAPFPGGRPPLYTASGSFLILIADKCCDSKNRPEQKNGFVF